VDKPSKSHEADLIDSILEEYSSEKFRMRLFNKIDELLSVQTASDLKRRLNAIDLKKGVRL